MPSSSQRDIFGKVLGVVIALSGLAKLFSVPDTVANFNTWHLGDTWRYVIGAYELVCGALLFVPGLARYGAFAFFLLMPAAVLAHLTSGQGPLVAMPLVFGAAVFFYLRARGAIRLAP